MNEELTVRSASLEGTDGNDVFTLRADDITLRSGAGNDAIEIYAQRNSIDAGEGDNYVYISDVSNTLTAGGGDNFVVVFDDNNHVTAGDGDNRLVNNSRNNTLMAGNGNNTLDFNGTDNIFSLGGGNNVVTGADRSDTLTAQYADLDDDNIILTGDGADLITLEGDDNYIHSGDGDDTIVVKGDVNMIFGGWLEDDEMPSDVGDDDVMTVRGDDNTIDAGGGCNVITLEGKGNVYDGSGDDTVRAEAINSSITGAVDVEIEGDGNLIEVDGGRLISSGNETEIYLFEGAEATINGDNLDLTVEDSRAVLNSDNSLIFSTNATIDVSTLTGASFMNDGELVVNGQRYKGAAIMRMTNGEFTNALAANEPLEGFSEIAIDVGALLTTATIDGVAFEVVTMPSGILSDGVVEVKGNKISGIGRSEGVKVSKAGTYTVNGSRFEVTPDDTLVGTDDWAGLRRENTLDNILLEGTPFNDAITNLGAGVTVDGGLGEDSISLGSAAREFVAFNSTASIEAEGFETGFDAASDVVLSNDDLRDYRFEFGVSGVHIFNGGAELDMVNTGFDTVNFLLQNDEALIKFTALNGGVTTEATGADFYALSDEATLYAGDAPFTVNGVFLPEDYLSGATVIGGAITSDYEFAALKINSPLVGEYTVHGVSYDSVLDSVDAAGQFFVFDGAATINNYSGEGFFNALHFGTDGRVTVEIEEGAPINDALRSIRSITGIGAGEHFTIGSMVNGDYVYNRYTVSADGQAIYDPDGNVTWTGADVSTVNLMDVYANGELTARLRQLLLPPFYNNVAEVEDGAHFNVSGMRTTIETMIGSFGDRLTEASTADGVIAAIDDWLSERYGLVLSNVLGAAAIDALKERLTASLKGGSNAIDALSAAIEAGALLPFSTEEFMSAFFEKLGVQAAGADFGACLTGGNSALEQIILGQLAPNVLAGENALSVFEEMFRSMKFNLTARRMSGHVNWLVKDDASTSGAALYVDSDSSVIDASGSTLGAHIYNTDGKNTSIIGSAQRDIIVGGAGATIQSGAGVEDYVILASGEGAVTVNNDIPSTVLGLTEALDAYIVRAEFIDAHTREYIGLSNVSSVKAFGFETGFDDTSDVIMVGDVDNLQFAFDGATVDVIDGEGRLQTATSSDKVINVMLRADNALIKATAINGGQSITATGADRYYAGEGATLTGLTAGDAFAIVSDGGAIAYSISADGTSITRTDNDRVVWSGNAEDLTGVNVLELGEGDDTTSEAPVDSGVFIDSSKDNINVTLTGASRGIINIDAAGDKILTAGNRSTTLENYSDAAHVTLVGSARSDSLFNWGGDALIDVSKGGRDTIELFTGNVNVIGYDATKAAFAVDGVSTLDAYGFASYYVRVVLDGDHSKGVFAAFVDEDGNRQTCAWNDADAVIDGSNINQPLLVQSAGWSTVKGGDKDDTINATGGDFVQLGQGHDLVTIDDRQSGEVTIDLGTRLSHTTVNGFDDDIIKVDDVSALKVKVTDYGMRLRAGNAFLTLAGVEDTVRITDGSNEFVLHTDYRDMLPNFNYVLEDEDRIVRTPDGALEIDDDIFTFNGGNDVAINGFDERWELRAGEGVEVERMTTLVNGTVKFNTNRGSVKIRK